MARQLEDIPPVKDPAFSSHTFQHYSEMSVDR